MLAGLLALAPLAVRAQESTWTATSRFWNTAGLWAPSQPIFSALINNSGTAIVAASQVGGALNVTLGSTGTGNLLITGGVFQSVDAVLGSQAGSYGSATVTGGIWAIFSGGTTGEIAVGNSGTGTLLINGSAATVYQPTVFLGNRPGAAAR